MSLEDFYAAQPLEPVGPDALGLPPAPTPPQMPTAPTGKRGRNPADLAAILTAAMLGPGAGTGVLQGVQASKQREREQEMLQQRQAQQLYQQQEQLYRFQQQQYEQEANRRQQTLQQNLKALQANVPTLKTKADYDRTIDTFAMGLQQMGLRVDGNQLRRMVPYVAPNGMKAAQDAIEQWKKNPQNENILKNNPEQAAIATIPVDRDGDGIPEKLTLDEAMTLAGMPFSKDPSGKIIWSPPGTSKADAMSDEAEYLEELALMEAEGKDVKSNAPSAIRARQAARDRVRVRADQRKVSLTRQEAAARRVADDQAKPTDKEWVIRNGEPIQIDKGTARPGDRPWTASDAKLQATGDDAQAKRQTLADNALQAIATLEQSSGFNAAFGAPGLTQPGSWGRLVGMGALPGSQAADAQSALSRLMGLIALPELQNMRGLGAMSDREFATISAAASSLNPRMSDEAARSELERLKLAFEAMRAGRAGTPVGDIGKGRRIVYDINGNVVDN